jgi:hypothetical protein
MKRSVCTFLMAAFIAIIISYAFGAAKGGYEKDLTGVVWIETAGSEVIEYTFTNKKYACKFPSMSIVFDVVKIDNVNHRIILSINRKFVPMWWEKVDTNTIKVTQLDNGLYTASLAQALKKTKPVKQSTLKKKK